MIKIKRFDSKKEPNSIIIEYPITEGLNLLALLHKLKSTLDPTLSFAGVCRSGVCGSCSVMVNGKPALACSYTPKSGDLIEPLVYHPVKRDLIVDKTKALHTLSQAETWIHEASDTPRTTQTLHLIERQSNCILCSSCYAACPVMAVNNDFLGPFALTRALRYTTDALESKSLDTLTAIQSNGIWDCTLCGECTAVCPQNIDPKMDILNLRSKSVQNGFNDPTLVNMNFGFDFTQVF